MAGLAGLCFWEGRVESVVFDKKRGLVIITRSARLCSMSSKTTWQRLDHIRQVYAARKGLNKNNMDMTYFVLILRLHNDVRIKILETKNAQRCRKEVSRPSCYNLGVWTAALREKVPGAGGHGTRDLRRNAQEGRHQDG